MDNKLYVGNLPYNTTEDDLRSLFGQAGTVTSADVIKDRMTGTSKGFAFVEMSTAAEAQNAIQKFNGYKINNRELRVSIARPREDSGSGGYGGQRRSGGGGGYGNRGGGEGRGGQRRY